MTPFFQNVKNVSQNDGNGPMREERGFQTTLIKKAKKSKSQPRARGSEFFKK